MSKNNDAASYSSSGIKKPLSTKMFYGVGFAVITFFAIICLLPFVMMITGSLSTEDEIIRNGYALYPRKFTLEAYKSLGVYLDQILQSYKITILTTLVGTLSTLFLTSMTGYVLSRSDFPQRNKVSFFIYFTTLFSGGMIPSYIVNTQLLHLKNSFWVYIIPALMSPFNIFLVKNFLKSIPDSLVESARIDGAGEFYIYCRIIIPLAKPCLATIALFTALGHWNNWFTSSIYITDSSKYSLQYVLYNILQNAQYLEEQARASGNYSTSLLPKETVKLAMAVITVGPVILLYPFLQKYFVEGLTIGGIKG